MRKFRFILAVCLLAAILLTGCSSAPHTEIVETEAHTTIPDESHDGPITEVSTETPAETVMEPTVEETEEDIVYEGDAATYYIDVAYTEQIGRYAVALSEKWNEEQYMSNGMSEVPAAYYEGNPLENVGFGFVDLDNDGYWELIIGAILESEEYPAVFEIWTRVNDEPVMLAQAHARSQYTLQYVEEDGMWYVVNEGSNSAFNSATYYLMLSEGEFEVVQGIVFDATADEQNPWFMTYDLDWDVSNDAPIDEETAMAILESNRKHYTALEYFPYIYF